MSTLTSGRKSIEVFIAKRVEWLGKLMAREMRNTQRRIKVTRTLSPEVYCRLAIGFLASNIFEPGNSLRGQVVLPAAMASGLVLRQLGMTRRHKIETLNDVVDRFKEQGKLKKMQEAESL